MKSITRLLIVSFTLLSAASTAFSQVIINPPGTTNPPTRPSRPSESLPTRPVTDDPIPDIQFIQRTGEGLIFEFLAGSLALTHSNSPAVRKFARRMIRDSSRNYQKLSTVAIRSGLQVPTGPDNDQNDELKKLTKLFGPAFNQEYLRLVTQEQLESSQNYLNEIRNGVLARVRNFASQGLPEINLHLQLAFIAARQSGVVLAGQ